MSIKPPLPKVVSAGTSALQSGMSHQLMLWLSPEAQMSSFVALLVHPHQLVCGEHTTLTDQTCRTVPWSPPPDQAGLGKMLSEPSQTQFVESALADV